MEHETKPPIIHLSRPIPTANSTIPELISYLRSAHQKEYFDLVMNILLAREENLNKSIKEMSVEVINRKKDFELIESKNSRLVLEKVAIEDELKKCRMERDGVCDELKKCRMERDGVSDELKKCRFECGELRDKLVRSVEELNLYVGREKRAVKRYKQLVVDSEEAESRLKGEKIRAEAEIVAWKKKNEDWSQRVLKLEEDIAGLVENVEEELLGADSSFKNHDNGWAINKQIVPDSRSQSQMMASTVIGNGKSEIIELDDSDDDGDDDKPNGNGIVLTATSASELGSKETCGKLISSQTGEKDIRGCKETSTPHSMPNTKRASRSEILETDIGQHKMRRLQEMGHEPKVSSSFFDTSNLGDKSFTEDLVDNPKGERECKAWKYEVDMIRAFEKDHKICMNAVCAIYRQQKSKEKSSNPLLLGSNQGFNQFDVLSGTKLCELLIDGDSEGKLRKSVSDLQQHNPKALNECRKLAIRYSKQLFQIYKSKKDPFFFPS